MSEHGRREVWWITATCLIVSGLGIACAVSPSLEAALNRWVGVPVVVVSTGALVVLIARSVWSWLLIEWELRRPLHPDEINPRRPEEV